MRITVIFIGTRYLWNKYKKFHIITLYKDTMYYLFAIGETKAAPFHPLYLSRPDATEIKKKIPGILQLFFVEIVPLDELNMPGTFSVIFRFCGLRGRLFGGRRRGPDSSSSVL